MPSTGSSEPSTTQAAIRDLKDRVSDWKGCKPSTLGALHQYSLLFVERVKSIKQYHVYLFSNAVFCFKEKPTSSLSLSTSKVKDKSKADSKKKPSLKITGTVWLRDVQQVVDISTLNSFRLTFVADKADITFNIIFESRDMKTQWQKTASKLVAAAQSIASGVPAEVTSPSTPSPSTWQIVAELDQYVRDWKGSLVEELGQLEVYETLTVRRGTQNRPLQVYLFQEAILCLERLSRRKKSSDHQTRSLRIKGRVFIRHIKNIMKSTKDELMLTIDLHDQKTETFAIIFQDRPTLDLWALRLWQLMFLRNSSDLIPHTHHESVADTSLTTPAFSDSSDRAFSPPFSFSEQASPTHEPLDWPGEDQVVIEAGKGVQKGLEEGKDETAEMQSDADKITTSRLLELGSRIAVFSTSIVLFWVCDKILDYTDG